MQSRKIDNELETTEKSTNILEENSALKGELKL